MIDNLHWLGHASFRLDGSKTIYFDPWKLSGGSKKADIILISHEHFDHFSKEDVMKIVSKDTVIVTSDSVSKQLNAFKLNCKEIRAMAPGETLELPSVTIKSVASYNLNKPFHKKDDRKLGFIVTMDGMSIYHAGDTDNVPEIKNHKCDIALLPVSGTYVMTAQEAAQAALLIKPKAAIPMHYGDVAGSIADAEKFKDLLKGKIEVNILKKEN